MNPTSPRWPVAAVLAGLCVAGSAFGDVYYDGLEARTVTLQGDLRAEFAHAEGARPVRAVAGAVVLPGVGDSLVRIYRVPARSAAQGAGDAAAVPAGSPVYREGDSPAGRLMALPGGVLVKFKPEWARERIDAWLAARSLGPARPLAMAGNWYFVGTAAGTASLQTANALHATGDVLAATPNWWKQTAAR
jgi:hypothetical protein